MAEVILFHSLYGRRPAIVAAAARLRAAGHHAVAPDLYDAPATETLDEASALLDAVGWDAVMERARDALRGAPATTILIGFSMGASVAQSLLDDRPATRAMVLLHSTGFARPAVRAGLPVQLHVADPDEQFAPRPEVEEWTRALTDGGAAVETFRYPGAGHIYTDTDLPDHDELAAAATWDRVLGFLDRLGPGDLDGGSRRR